MLKDSLGDRMKQYETAYRVVLPRRMPLIIRVDGKAFHTYTRKFPKPFSQDLIDAMDDTALYLCSEIQGAVLAYVQSDEISVLVHNYKRLESEAWFDNQLQKMVSVAASSATAQFNESMAGTALEPPLNARFDARAFVLPEAEVCNYFIWRQQDAVRNSIQMLARSYYSHKECNGKSCPELQEMIHAEGVNWNWLPISQKRGRCAVKDETGWKIDGAIPTFTEGRDYINERLEIECSDPR